MAKTFGIQMFLVFDCPVSGSPLYSKNEQINRSFKFIILFLRALIYQQEGLKTMLKNDDTKYFTYSRIQRRFF